MKKTLILSFLMAVSLAANAVTRPSCSDWITVPNTNNAYVQRTCEEEVPHPVFPFLFTTRYTTEYAPTNNIPQDNCPCED